MATTTERYDGLTITIATPDETIFENCVTDGLDLDASLARFADVLCERVAADYPGATVRTSRHDAYADTVDGPDRDRCDQVSDELWPRAGSLPYPSGVAEHFEYLNEHWDEWAVEEQPA